MTTTNTNADDVARADLNILIDGHHVTALVNTGAEFSIMRQELADRIRKVQTPWTGPHISAGGQLMTPTGTCTARIHIGDSSFVATFVIIPYCSKNLILGMDFLVDHGAAINVPERMVTFSASLYVDTIHDGQRESLRISDDGTIQPRSCRLAYVSCQKPYHGNVIAEQIVALLLTQSDSIARGVLDMTHGHAEVLLTEFSNERRHIHKYTATAYCDDITQVKDCLTVQRQETTVPASTRLSVDVSSTLSPSERQRLLELIHQFEDCFSTPLKVKHQ